MGKLNNRSLSLQQKKEIEITIDSHQKIFTLSRVPTVNHLRVAGKKRGGEISSDLGKRGESGLQVRKKKVGLG